MLVLKEKNCNSKSEQCKPAIQMKFTVWDSNDNAKYENFEECIRFMFPKAVYLIISVFNKNSFYW